MVLPTSFTSPLMRAVNADIQWYQPCDSWQAQVWCHKQVELSLEPDKAKQHRHLCVTLHSCLHVLDLLGR